MTIQIRRSDERGYFDYEWLKTYHTFSFGQYYDPQHINFRSLRVLNEDRVRPGVGFPIHAHHDMEILSIVLSGSLAHQDDMGNGSILYPGHVQLITAGTGITHSETNASDKEEVHFLQVWILPNKKNLSPSYQEKTFNGEVLHNRWALIASENQEENSIKIHQDVKIYLAELEAGVNLVKELGEGHSGWLQIIQGEATLNQHLMNAGDGAAISQITQFEVSAQTPTKLLFFDLS